ncbi:MULTISPECIES: hypothetical protein [Acinetobacter]|uniref:hypothetical protein n=1 Tax=Acinetobacter TaxID=469 RepID=UPI0002CFF7B5|nr:MULTISPECIES: hypothetical protein [Acinetobacter]ENX63761.1 hypothetical protein F885_00505 [Acinetobacter higginsii]MCH7317290.1 hypothetical protein [Acinetobacter higginsii]MCI3881237.1 hypothetical protein [Acinetobacter higginsii]
MIDNNIFLKKLYPSGIVFPVRIGRFSVDLSGYCDIDFHVSERPGIDIKKYGLWGEDYNTVVIKLKGRLVGSIYIENWIKNSFGELVFEDKGKYFVLKVHKDDFVFSIEIEGLIFQELSVYFDGVE